MRLSEFLKEKIISFIMLILAIITIEIFLMDDWRLNERYEKAGL